MSMPHPASHPEKQTDKVRTWLVPWEITGTAMIQAKTATEAKLKFQQLHQEDIAASGELFRHEPEPAEDAQ